MRIRIRFLAIDVYSYDYTKDWKDIADHLEDIPAGFLSYLNLKQSEYNLKKRLMGNVNVTEQYQKSKVSKGILFSDFGQNRYLCDTK